jgi:regulator of telomere elongation helicase 1
MSNHAPHNIRNIPVEFPFKPYRSQLVYMEKVIEALQNGSNALLESPTGTGKTMSLLCSVLAWRQAQEAQLGAAAVSNGSSASLKIQYDLELATGMSAYENVSEIPSTTDEHGWARRARTNRDRDGFQGFASGKVGSSSSFDSQDTPLLRPKQHASKIIYTARTHSQLSQVVKELKATAYRPNVCILGSREQLCVHPKVSKERGTKQNRACQCLVKERKCRYYIGVEDYMSKMKISSSSSSSNSDIPDSGINVNASSVSRFHVNIHSDTNKNQSNRLAPPRSEKTEIQDIEELHEFGKKKIVCPYYLSRQRTNADIYFMPYNYVVDPNVRNTLSDLQWNDCVLICDEAHNLESLCESASSFELKPEVIAAAIDECDDCLYMMSSDQTQQGSIGSLSDAAISGDITGEKVGMLKSVLKTFELKISQVKFEPNENSFTASGAWLLSLCSGLNITKESKIEFFDVIDGNFCRYY